MSSEANPHRLDPKPVSASRTTITELMIPSYANFGGKIHGGILLSLMDKVAYACASRHAGTYCVTVSVDGVDFLQPAEVGDLVSLKASVNYVGRTSLVVGIRVEAENVERAEMRHTNTSYITLVAKDEHGEPTPVPKLILETDEDIRRFVTAYERRQDRARDREVMARYKDQFSIDDRARDVLAGARCLVEDALRS
ncbi:MAG: acyl-CoA thioesterase [Xanthomonadales bacterium]|jgi:uncharacterized protein (TIGR00369 family)|nr:acyl-CoA thioesterase [Xanthomonadales bacterium]